MRILTRGSTRKDGDFAKSLGSYLAQVTLVLALAALVVVIGDKQSPIAPEAGRGLSAGMIAANAFDPLWDSLPQAATPAAEPRSRILTAQEIKDVMPATVFFRGQSAPIQLRNSGGIRTKAGELVLMALVDNSGYSTGTAEKYQGYLLTEVKLELMGKQVAPGAYGIGFLNDGTFLMMDIGAHDLLRVASKKDLELRRPKPFNVVEAGSGFRLYMGKQYVDLTIVP